MKPFDMEPSRACEAACSLEPLSSDEARLRSDALFGPEQHLKEVNVVYNSDKWIGLSPTASHPRD